MAIDKWEHLFSKGEYPTREKLLEGLTLDQVNAKPNNIPHSIFEELWHLTQWQDVVTKNDNELFKKWEEGQVFPEAGCGSEEEWKELVKKFNDGLVRIFEYVKVPGNLEQEIEPGFTINDTLQCLAVHNAVHFGKILAVRQTLGIWNPEKK